MKWKVKRDVVRKYKVSENVRKRKRRKRKKNYRDRLHTSQTYLPWQPR